ncbi:MAG: CarD family transcriptional regulator [Alphaproteobacteria bacterium]
MPKKVVTKARKTIKKAAPAKKKAVARKPVAKKKTVAKAPASKAVTKKPVRKVAAKKPVQKAAPQKVVSKKLVTTSAVVKKPVAKVEKPIAKPVAKVPVVDSKNPYKVGCYVVYPTHGVGRITAEETQMIGDVQLRMLVISFEKDKMTLRVPLHRVTAAGLRPVSTIDEMRKVFDTLKSKARISRGMWSRRAQEYESKINSGCVISVAEVVRDLHQNVDQSERSYSERMIYESALARLVGELAAAESTNHDDATDKLMKLLRGKIAKQQAAEAQRKAA